VLIANRSLPQPGSTSAAKPQQLVDQKIAQQFLFPSPTMRWQKLAA